MRAICLGLVFAGGLLFVASPGVAAGAEEPGFSPGVVNARPCFPGAYYRKAVSSVGQC